MVFRQFRWNITLRVVLLFITLLVITWLIVQTNYYATIALLTSIGILQVILLLKYVEQMNSEITRFLSSIHYDDFSTTYSAHGKGKAFDDLNKELTRVVKKFQEIRAEKEAQYHYLRSIVQHINIGLLAIDEQCGVQLINNAAKRLLKINDLKHLQDLEEELSILAERIENLGSGEKEVIKLNLKDEYIQLAISATSIKLLGHTYKLVSLQDIHSELEEKEMEAWQNLTRVLTHEIINSVTPITSLASTLAEGLNEQVHKNGGYEHIEAEEIEDAHRAIQVIQKRAEGLVRFVTDFRNFTKVPSPKFKIFKVEELFSNIEMLMRDEFRANSILLLKYIEPQDLKLTADPELIEQILINLVKNSIQAIADKEDGRIELIAIPDESGKVLIKVRDNGMGISEEARKNIFVPFFTTKKTGSGIGLSLSRQIMRTHGGSISVHSIPKQETTFTLKFA